jgi:hypothetical protein
LESSLEEVENNEEEVPHFFSLYNLKANKNFN